VGRNAGSYWKPCGKAIGFHFKVFFFIIVCITSLLLAGFADALGTSLPAAVFIAGCAPHIICAASFAPVTFNAAMEKFGYEAPSKGGPLSPEAVLKTANKLAPEACMIASTITSTATCAVAGVGGSLTVYVAFGGVGLAPLSAVFSAAPAPVSNGSLSTDPAEKVTLATAAAKELEAEKVTLAAALEAEKVALAVAVAAALEAEKVALAATAAAALEAEKATLAAAELEAEKATLAAALAAATAAELEPEPEPEPEPAPDPVLPTSEPGPPLAADAAAQHAGGRLGEDLWDAGVVFESSMDKTFGRNDLDRCNGGAAR